MAKKRDQAHQAPAHEIDLARPARGLQASLNGGAESEKARLLPGVPLRLHARGGPSASLSCRRRSGVASLPRLGMLELFLSGADLASRLRRRVPQAFAARTSCRSVRLRCWPCAAVAASSCWAGSPKTTGGHKMDRSSTMQGTRATSTRAPTRARRVCLQPRPTPAVTEMPSTRTCRPWKQDRVATTPASLLAPTGACPSPMPALHRTQAQSRMRANPARRSPGTPTTTAMARRAATSSTSRPASSLLPMGVRPRRRPAPSADARAHHDQTGLVRRVPGIKWAEAKFSFDFPTARGKRNAWAGASPGRRSLRSVQLASDTGDRQDRSHGHGRVRSPLRKRDADHLQAVADA